MIDLTNLKKISQQFQIDEFTVLREYLQIHFLDKFYQQSNLNSTYFKGGTALRLIFGSSRFSEDLDFTSLLPVNNIKGILKQTVKILDAQFPNITIKDVDTIQGYSAKLYLPTEISKQHLTVKLDFSQREEVVQTLTSPVETQLPVTSIALVEHLSKEEMLAEKMRALKNRRKGRDLFDLWFLLSKQTSINQKLIQKKFDFYDDTFNIEDIKRKIDSWGEKELDQDLRRFLPRQERRVIPELKRIVLEKLERVGMYS